MEMKINIDLTMLSAAQFRDELHGEIIYVPFDIEIDGKRYPSDTWEDYAIVNLVGWAKELTRKGNLDDRVFEFMDDAWEIPTTMLILLSDCKMRLI